MFSFAQRISVFALAAVGLYAQTATPAPTQEVSTFGMIGVASGQTARVNVLNPGILAPAVGVLCSAQLTFWDAEGKELKTTSVTVAPGTSASFDAVSDADLAIAANGRKEIRATIAIPITVPPPPSTAAATVAKPCALIGTLEIFDTLSGRTLVSLGAPHPVPSIVPVATERAER